jgi:hypothetical protein
VTLTDIERDLARLEVDLKQLETEYTMYFAGRLPRPPWNTRAKVEAAVKKIDRSPLLNTALRFRFTTVQSRYAAFIDLWERGQRAREEGRSAAFVRLPADPREQTDDPNEFGVVHATSLRDPELETEKLDSLYRSLATARREAGAVDVSFDRFEAIVRSHMEKMKAEGCDQVAFRVAVKDGKVRLTARAHKNESPSGE